MREAGTADLAVIGAGAAGLAIAIFCARHAPGARVVCLDGARTIGAKILVSGGSRCNVTNRVVSERDFWGGSSRVVRHVLRAFSAARATAFFEELGVPLHEEEDGKLFPETNRSRTILDALLREVRRLGIELYPAARVARVTRATEAAGGAPFRLAMADGSAWPARHVALATGGRSLPKTGSDGAGYDLARALGHSCVPTTPALAPLLLEGGWHMALSGVTHGAELALRIDRRIATRLAGSLLWTHFGASGPVVLNASRHWHRAVLDGHAVDVLLSVCPGESFEEVDAWLLAQGRERPKAAAGTVLASRVPAAVAATLLEIGGVDPLTPMAHLDRETRRAVVRALVEQPLQVTDSRGYGYAEVTAGGVPLEEIDSATMESRRCPGLYLAGEILDVDGRLGGFNFQWAWSSGFVAGTAIATEVRPKADATY